MRALGRARGRRLHRSARRAAWVRAGSAAATLGRSTAVDVSLKAQCLTKSAGPHQRFTELLDRARMDLRYPRLSDPENVANLRERQSLEVVQAQHLLLTVAHSLDRRREQRVGL